MATRNRSPKNRVDTRLDGEEALETLAFASMLMRRLESAQPTRAANMTSASKV